MVLEGASASEEPSFSESLPSSDVDPYASSGPEYRDGRELSYLLVTPPGPNAVYVNLNNLPRRWSLFFRKAHPGAVQEGIKQQCQVAQNILGRPVTQEEADAFAFHMSKSVRIGSYGTPTGVALATVQAFRTQKDFRFPGWSPFKEGSTRSPDAFGPLRGAQARACWHSTRMGVYWLVGSTVGQIFFGSYAISVALAGRSMDARLREFNEALRTRMKSGQGLQGSKSSADESDGPRQEETFEMARQRREAQGVWKNRAHLQESRRSIDDDASPTGGSFEDDFMQNPSDTGLLNDRQMRKDDSTSTTVYPDDTNSRPRDSDFSSSSPQPRSIGSSWDRLRQNAMSGSGQTSPSSTRPSVRSTQPEGTERGSDGSSGSFSFSQKDENRQLAKSEAQKDFNARIEREREGKDFNDRENGGKRW